MGICYFSHDIHQGPRGSTQSEILEYLNSLDPNIKFTS